MDAMLVLDGLTKKYQEVVAVKDLSLELHEGEFLTDSRPQRVGQNHHAENGRRAGDPHQRHDFGKRARHNVSAAQ